MNALALVAVRVALVALALVVRLRLVVVGPPGSVGDKVAITTWQYTVTLHDMISVANGSSVAITSQDQCDIMAVLMMIWCEPHDDNDIALKWQ